MPLYGVQGASTETDRQVINKECSEDVFGNTRGQLINLQSKTCHSQDAASWDTFLWVEFIRECGPDSDSNSAIPAIFRHENRQSASEPNPVQVTYNARLSHKPFQDQRRDQLPVVSVQRNLWRTFRDSSGGPLCCDAFRNQTGGHYWWCIGCGACYPANNSDVEPMASIFVNG